MKIYIGADHNGFNIKRQIIDYLTSLNHQVVDAGDKILNPSDDFPKFAAQVVDKLLGSKDQDARGMLVCGSGQGMCMAANRFKRIRASLCWNTKEAFDSRNDDDSNILCLSSSQLSVAQMKQIINVWLNTPFAGSPRFVRRLKQLDSLG